MKNMFFLLTFFSVFTPWQTYSMMSSLLSGLHSVSIGAAPRMTHAVPLRFFSQKKDSLDILFRRESDCVALGYWLQLKEQAVKMERQERIVLDLCKKMADQKKEGSLKQMLVDLCAYHEELSDRELYKYYELGISFENALLLRNSKKS